MTTATLEPVSAAEEESFLPRVLPAGWMRHPRWSGPAYDCHSLTSPLRGVRVLVSVGVEEDGKKWAHVSLSRPDRVPSWEDVATVKAIFVGADRWAYQVLPPAREHYSLPDGAGRTGKVLHLWSPLDGEPRLPNFLRARGGTL